MEKYDKILKSMNFEFFGSGKHKIKSSAHFSSENGVFLDVRSKEEYETLSFNLIHHMPVIHIPITEIPSRFNEIPKNDTVGIFCSSGVRASIVYAYLRRKGFENVRILEGGYNQVTEEFNPGKLLKKIKSKKN